MSFHFTKLEVRSFDLDHLDLFWEVSDCADDPEEWDLFVLRSVDGPGGPFEQHAGPFRHDGIFRDAHVNRLHNWRSYYYQIKAVHKTSGKEVTAGPAVLEAPPDLITIELRRRFELMCQEFNGRKVLVYPALTSGFRCRHCYDMGSNDRGRTIGRQRTQNCATCFDTTFTGGFGAPVRAWMQIDPTTKDVQRTDTSEGDRQDTTCRLSAFPPLKPKDMIVEAENVRWMVERVSATKKLRAVVHQEPTLHRIPSSHILYNVSVDEAALADPGPKREFTRPMNLETAQGNRVKRVNNLLDSLLGDK